MEPVDFREVVLERLEAGARLLASIPVAGEGTSDLCAIPVMVISGRQPGPVFCVNAGTQERPPELRRRRCRDKDRGAQYQRDRNYSSRHKRCDANLANARLDLAFL